MKVNLIFIKKHGFALTFFVIGLLSMFYPILFSLGQWTQFDRGDARLNNLILEHGWQSIVLQKGHFWDAPFFYPIKNVLAYSDVLLGSAPLYWINRLMGFLPDSAFQVWMIQLALLNYFVAYFFLVRLKNAKVAAIAGAYLFAFCSYRQAQLSHIQLHPHFYSLLMFWSLFEFNQSPKKRWIYLSFLCWVLQFYAGFYLGWFLSYTLLLIAFFGATHFFISFKGHYLDKPFRNNLSQIKKYWIHFVLAFTISIFLLYPMFDHYIMAAHVVGMRGLSQVFPPFLQSWIYQGPESFLYGWLYQISVFKNLPYQLEHYLGMGFATSVFACFGIANTAKNTSKPVYWGLVLTLLLLILSSTLLTDHLWIWPSVFNWVPGAQAIRALPRVFFAALPFIAFILARFFTHLTLRFPKGLSYCFLVVLVTEQVRSHPFYDKLQARVPVDQIVQKLNQGKCSAFLYAPSGAPGKDLPNYVNHLDASWAALQTGIPTLNGYSGNFPPGWPFWDPRIKSFADSVTLRGNMELWVQNNQKLGEEICLIE